MNHDIKRVNGKLTPYRTVGSFEDFLSKYEPIENTLSGHDYLEDEIEDYEDDQIWTVVEGDSGSWYICPGFVYVNRTGYYIVCKNFRGYGYHRDYCYT